jgi:hypothetical protein
VNDRLETTAANVWALGECAGSPQFTHASVDDFRIIADNQAGANRGTRDRLVPYCVFTDPPLAHVGLSERDAQRMGIAVRVATLPVEAVLRTHTTGETYGFMKVLVSASDDRILGFTMIGSGAGEVMAAMQTAMLANLSYTTLRDAVIAHLTMAEDWGRYWRTCRLAEGGGHPKSKGGFNGQAVAQSRRRHRRGDRPRAGGRGGFRCRELRGQPGRRGQSCGRNRQRRRQGRCDPG